MLLHWSWGVANLRSFLARHVEPPRTRSPSIIVHASTRQPTRVCIVVRRRSNTDLPSEERERERERERIQERQGNPRRDGIRKYAFTHWFRGINRSEDRSVAMIVARSIDKLAPDGSTTSITHRQKRLISLDAWASCLLRSRALSRSIASDRARIEITPRLELSRARIIHVFYLHRASDSKLQTIVIKNIMLAVFVIVQVGKKHFSFFSLDVTTSWSG